MIGATRTGRGFREAVTDRVAQPPSWWEHGHEHVEPPFVGPAQFAVERAGHLVEVGGVVARREHVDAPAVEAQGGDDPLGFGS